MKVVTQLCCLCGVLAIIGCQTTEGGSGSKQLGETCASSGECEGTLVCSGTDNACARLGNPGTSEQGDGCASNDDCIVELICGSSSTCTFAGTGTAGDPCAGNENCEQGLVCSANLKCAQPGTVGAKLAGETCDSPTDCALGLLCLFDECSPLQFWAGVSCTDAEGDPVAYFEIPRDGSTVEEFYRLPFPNDIRLKSGRVDVTGHPIPGLNLPAGFGNVSQAYLDSINADVTGFGVNTRIFLRFSHNIGPGDFDSLLAKEGNSFTRIKFVNLTTGGQVGSFGVGVQDGGGKYICPNWMTVHANSALAADSTYAVILMKGVKTRGTTSVDFAPDHDLAIVLSDTAPPDSDAEGKAAWQKYAALRSYLDTQSINPNDVLNATVFTTMDPQQRMASFREVVQAHTATDPAGTHGSGDDNVGTPVLCDGVSAVSPCAALASSHACPGSVDAEFDEVHGVYRSPVFQHGEAPYLTYGKTDAEKFRGDISYNAQEKPVVDHVDDVCYAISVPKGDPTSGTKWPLVIFAHGTGGNFRSFINNGTAKRLAGVNDGSGSEIAKIAVISIDAAMHGPRANSEEDPDRLFFNLPNPKAARDNVYQGAVDKMQLVRIVQSQAFMDKIEAALGRASFEIDPTKIYFFGHSQGTVEGIPFLAHEPDVMATVLSGAGGKLIDSFLHKTKPVNVKAAVQFALGETQPVSSNHPMLNLLQMFFEGVDSINYGRALFHEPVAGVTAKDTLLTYGIADSFTPPVTIENLVRVAKLNNKMLNQAAINCGDGVCNGTETNANCSDDCSSGKTSPIFGTVDVPAGGLTGNASGTTAAVAPFTSHDGSYDDHQVAFQNPNGRLQTVRFLGSAAADGTPTIPPAE